MALGLIARLHGFSIFKFVRYIKEELLIVLGTSSSESVLPRMMAKPENAGAKKSVVGLVIPTGYSFNLDGTSIQPPARWGCPSRRCTTSSSACGWPPTSSAATRAEGAAYPGGTC